MTNTIPRERTASSLELAREAARMLSCNCGARPGYTCDGKGGMHLVRFIAAYHAGCFGVERMEAVLLAVGPVYTANQIIPGGAR
jgi:hypothetical protein